MDPQSILQKCPIEYDELRKTYPQLGLHSLCLVGEAFVVPLESVVGFLVVCPRPGRLPPGRITLTDPNEAWEVVPHQKTQDAVDQAVVRTWFDDFPTPATSKKDEILVSIAISSSQRRKY
jgi:hypothetical protein